MLPVSNLRQAGMSQITDTPLSGQMSGQMSGQVSSQLSGETAAEAADGASARLALWLIGGAFALMTGASLVLWVVFGPSMFVSMMTAVVNCF